VHTATYIRNRCPSRTLDDRTPFKYWNNRKAFVKHLRIFGSRAFALTRPKGGKFQAKAKEYVFVGYSFTAKAYRLYDPQRRNVYQLRDVKFIEGEFSTKIKETSLNTNTNNDFQTSIIRFEPIKESMNTDQNTPEPINELAEASSTDDEEAVDDSDEGRMFVSANDDSDDQSADDTLMAQQRRPGRPKFIRTGQQGRPKKVYQTFQYLNYEEDEETPQSLEQALKGQL